MFFHQPFYFRGIYVLSECHLLIQFYFGDIYKDYIGQQEERLSNWEPVMYFFIQSVHEWGLQWLSLHR